MGKISTYTIDTSPVGGDFILGDQNSGTTTVRYTIGGVLSTLNKTRNYQMMMWVDNSGGGTITQQEANEVCFTGTPTAYGRASAIIPNDYVAGTTANVVLYFRPDSTNNQTIYYFIGCRASSGASYSAWNIASNATTASGIATTANVTSTFVVATIPSANLAAGNTLTIAFKPSSAVTGNIYTTFAVLQYTASV